MEVCVAIFAAVGVVSVVYCFFGAVFLKSAAGRIVTLVETSGDRDMGVLCVMWVSSFLAGGEVIHLPEEEEKLDVYLRSIGKLE
ncbi:MAG: hypothetical protein IKU11_10775 [Clostridia bacterium]|nr:hypothetical protein [Clostridia bacterium]